MIHSVLAASGNLYAEPGLACTLGRLESPASSAVNISTSNRWSSILPVTSASKARTARSYAFLRATLTDARRNRTQKPFAPLCTRRQRASRSSQFPQQAQFSRQRCNQRHTGLARILFEEIRCDLEAPHRRCPRRARSHICTPSDPQPRGSPAPDPHTRFSCASKRAFQDRCELRRAPPSLRKADR